MPITIAIADDSSAIRSALRLFIESNTDWDVCGEAADGQAAVSLVQRLKPDLLILDFSMPVVNGLEAARRIASVSPKTKIVLFTAHGCEQVNEQAESVGIRAVVPKDGNSTLERLITTLRDTTETAQAA